MARMKVQIRGDLVKAFMVVELLVTTLCLPVIRTMVEF